MKVMTKKKKTKLNIAAEQLEEYLNLLHEKVWMGVMDYLHHPNSFIWLEDEELKRLSATAWSCFYAFRREIAKTPKAYSICVGNESVRVLIKK